MVETDWVNPVESPRKWWAWQDSNLRPRHYQ